MNEILELFFNTNQNVAINLEELHNLELEIKKYKNINENISSNNKIKKKIKSKINKFIYKQRYDKQQNNNINQLRLTSLLKQQEMQRFSSKVSGRNLSAHVDNVNPEKKVVSVTYNSLNNNAATTNSTPIPTNNLNLQNTNSGIGISQNTSGNNQINIVDGNNISNNLQNIQNQKDINQISNNNNYNDIINQNNNQLNLIGQQNDNRQFDKNIVQQNQNQNIKTINPINNLNNNTTPINNIMSIQQKNIPSVPGNNLINLNSPNLQKNQIAINALLNNIKSPTSNNQTTQMIMMNSPQINLPERNNGININQLSNIAPNIPNPNINNINPLNFNNINNPNLPHIQNVQGITSQNQNIIPGLQQNNNNLGVMNYLNNIPNPLINLPNINQIIPGAQNYPNVHGQINNVGINNGLNNNINNGQFQNQFNPNIIPPMPQITPAQQILNKMDSSNLKKNNNNSNKSQTKKSNLMDTLQGILQDINSGVSSSSKDPRKNRKK